MAQRYMDTITLLKWSLKKCKVDEAPAGINGCTVERTVETPQIKAGECYRQQRRRRNNTSSVFLPLSVYPQPLGSPLPLLPHAWCVCGQWTYCKTLGLHKHNKHLMLLGQQQTSPLLTCSLRAPPQAKGWCQKSEKRKRKTCHRQSLAGS